MAGKRRDLLAIVTNRVNSSRDSNRRDRIAVNRLVEMHLERIAAVNGIWAGNSGGMAELRKKYRRNGGMANPGNSRTFWYQIKGEGVLNCQGVLFFFLIS